MKDLRAPEEIWIRNSHMGHRKMIVRHRGNEALEATYPKIGKTASETPPKSLDLDDEKYRFGHSRPNGSWSIP
jgi:hypothetical protein